jgi:hypothetical protein
MLQKQPININFSQGLNTKADPYQVPIGQFAALTNAIFTKDGLMQKRNGYGLLTAAPPGSQTLCTLNDGLVVLGNTCESYSEDSGLLTNAGIFQPMMMSTAPLVRSALGQIACDVAVASNGLSCSTYTSTDGNSYYQISDSVTGQVIIPAVLLPNAGTDSRVLMLGAYFIVLFLSDTVSFNLQYIAIPIANPSSPLPPATISSQAVSQSSGYDAVVVGTQMYVTLSCTGNVMRLWTLYGNLILSVPTTFTGTASLVSIVVDTSAGPTGYIIWVTIYNADVISTYAFNSNMTVNNSVGAVITIPTGVRELTSTATGNVLTIIYETINTYTYTPAAPEASDTETDYLSYITVTLAGAIGSPTIITRGLGLASKAIIVPPLSKTLVLATYGQQFQPTYFLIDLSGNVLARLAYSNGQGYLTTQVLPGITISGASLQVGYLYADLLQAVNKTQGASTTGVYAQLGVNLATFTLGGQTNALSIGGSLHASGGMLWQYDGVKIREFGFNVWPEDIGISTSTTGGSITAQQYFYQVTYEWTDAEGNIHRSAPSVPITVTTTGSTSSNTLHIPTLRQTYKTDNIVRIVIYRWSTANQEYYRITSITDPLLNDPTVDSVTYVDTASDASIIGNDIIYTTGGVIEDICAPAAVAMTLWQSRLFLADAEDPNLIWFSKQVIESTPVEMSDLLTLYVAPTTGAQGSTGPITALSSMDDKLIIFKSDAIYYITGQGPDNTGSNGTFSDPIFITSTVGCANPQSIILMPNGIMFQSDKGIWLLGRDLSTNYIGAMVETYTLGNTVTSALCIPATNQVRFTMNNNTAVMYDYYFNRWSDWTNVPAVSSVVYEGVQAYLNDYGQIVKETPNAYIDISTPVLLALITGWINLAGVQGYERFYAMNLLGTYYTPFTLDVQLAYDYNPSALQATTVSPDNYANPYGGEALWGSGEPWGGNGNVFSARVFPQKQKTQSFQVSINETYDPTFNVPAGQGLTLSGLLLLVGVKRGSRTQSAIKSFG